MATDNASHFMPWRPKFTCTRASSPEPSSVTITPSPNLLWNTPWPWRSTCPLALVAERLSARRVCQECGAIYRDSDIEAISGTCTNCGGDVVQRADDLPEAIMKRLEAYERDTAPLLSFYDRRGLLTRVDGDQDPQEVTAEILDALAERGVG